MVRLIYECLKRGAQMKKKIMVVEDDTSIATLLEYNLTRAEYEVISVADGLDALTSVAKVNPSLIILDLMLPGMDGLEVCRNVQQKQPHIPIIMLTAMAEEFDKVLGLELGADDYMTKPFSMRELLSRVKAVIRRTNPVFTSENQVDEHITLAELDIYPQKYEAYFRLHKLDLTSKEFELLLYLVKNKGLALSREQLLHAVWNFDFAGDTRIVDVHISNLRGKIEQNTKEPKYIKTIRGFGYKLEEVSKV